LEFLIAAFSNAGLGPTPLYLYCPSPEDTPLTPTGSEGEKGAKTIGCGRRDLSIEDSLVLLALCLARLSK
jgi:hypothetical protein